MLKCKMFNKTKRVLKMLLCFTKGTVGYEIDTETNVKAFKARNEYILSIDASNDCIKKFCTEDIGDLVDCMDFGFHASVVR